METLNIPIFPRASRLAFVFSTLLAFGLGAAHAANVDTDWNGAAGDGDWFNAANWTNGLPGDKAPDDIGRVFFRAAQGNAIENVTINGDALTNRFYVGNNSAKTLNLTLTNGSTFTVTDISHPVVGSGNGSSATANWNVFGPTSGDVATMNFNSLTLTGTATSSGSTATFSGAKLVINDNGAVTTVGRQGDGHTLTVNEGATWNGHGMVISGTTNITSGVGNNHKLVVDGAGTNMTLSGATGVNSTLALVVASRPLTGSSLSNVQSGNSVTVSNGASLRVIGDNPDATETVLIGAANYRESNSINVSGTGSVFEVSGDAITKIGYTSNSSARNKLTVSGGALFKTDAVLQIDNGSSILANYRNSLVIGDGGTVASNNVINNNGGLISLAAGGSLIGANLDGSAAALAVNINGTARFEAAGDGLGDNVTVNIGDGTGQAVLALGLAGHSSANSFTVNSALNLNAGSLLDVRLFAATGLDSITLGDDAVVTIDPSATLTVTGSGTIGAGSWQLFTGNVGNVAGSFGDIILPDLDEDLVWDLSHFNAADGWTLMVVPEPALAAILSGCGILTFACARRRRRA